jgi:uncharacterized membrane protein YbhN (UPF0104 family)
MRLNKNIKIFLNYFLGPLLFIWLSFSIYQQIRNQSHLEASWLHIKQSFQSSQVLYLLFTFLLMFVNWGLEAAKWRLAVQSVHKVSFLQAFKATLSGVAFSVTIPNRVGEYLGRMLYMPEGKRLKIISLTVICGISQLLVTLFAGTLGLLVLKDHLIEAGIISRVAYQFIAFGLLSFILILTLLYFNLSALEKWLERRLRMRSWLYLVQSVRSFDMQRLGRLLLLSGIRYGVFITQYILLFRLFEVNVSVVVGFWVMSLVFLALAVIPTIALIEVGLRGQISLQLIGLFAANNLGILLTSITIWGINLIIPALAGSLLILGLRLFNRRNGREKKLSSIEKPNIKEF